MGGGYSQVLPGLYQGGADVLGDMEFWETLNITHVVSLGVAKPPQKIKALFKLEVLHIEKDDISFTNLSENFQETSEFIHKARTNDGVVFIHCAAGISRSSTITLAYLMSWLNMDYKNAYEYLKLRRKMARPNNGFVDQLRAFVREGGRDKLYGCLYNPHAFPGHQELLKQDIQAIKHAQKEAENQKPYQGKADTSHRQIPFDYTVGDAEAETEAKPKSSTQKPPDGREAKEDD